MKSRSEYEFEIRVLRDAIQADPHNTEEYQNKLNYRVSKWIDLSNIFIFRANNEQTPWREEDIGYSVLPMPTKKECGFDQVGDYQFVVDCEKEFSECFGSLVVERKSKQDLYGTLFGDRERFYREIARYEKDPRFDQMVVIVESNFTDWLSFSPTPDAPGIAQRLASIASLQARNVPIYFAGSERLAPKFYRHLVRQNISKNYGKWIFDEKNRELGFC